MSSTEINRIAVPRERGLDPEKATVRYTERDDGWYVQTPVDDEYWRFAHSDARKRDVVQLINKKWNIRYGEPDDFDDRS